MELNEASPLELKQGLIILERGVESSQLTLAHRDDPTNQDIWLRILWNHFNSEYDLHAVPNQKVLNNITFMQSQIDLVKKHLE